MRKKINEVVLIAELAKACEPCGLDLSECPNLKAVVAKVELHLQRQGLKASLRPGKQKEQGSGVRRTWEDGDGKVIADVRDNILLVARAKSAAKALGSLVIAEKKGGATA